MLIEEENILKNINEINQNNGNLVNNLNLRLKKN